jgi:hypothetical protein
LVFDVVGLALDIGKLKENKKKEIILDFVNDFKYKSATNTYKAMLSDLYSGNSNDAEKIKKILSSPSFLELAEGLKKYLVDQGYSGAKDAIYGTVSDFIKDNIASINPILGVVTDTTYTAAKIGNVSRKIGAINEFLRSPKSPIVLSVQDENFTLPITTVQPNITDSVSVFNSCTTQYNTSHIGSAGCYFTDIKVADKPVQNEINESRPDSIQEKNTYTNGTIVKAPLDIGLTWNQSTKLDLDSHTVTPSGDHIYFSQRGSLTNAPNTFLYRDSIPDGGRLGAEQTRITTFQEGEYRFYVYNYSDQQNLFPSGLPNSAAKVQLFQGGAPLTDIPNDPNNFDLNNPALQKVGQPYPGTNTFNVPTGQSGNAWYVFKLNTRTGILNRVDRFSNVNGSSNVPKFK